MGGGHTWVRRGTCVAQNFEMSSGVRYDRARISVHLRPGFLLRELYRKQLDSECGRRFAAIVVNPSGRAMLMSASGMFFAIPGANLAVAM